MSALPSLSRLLSPEKRLSGAGGGMQWTGTKKAALAAARLLVRVEKRYRGLHPHPLLWHRWDELPKPSRATFRRRFHR